MKLSEDQLNAKKAYLKSNDAQRNNIVDIDVSSNIKDNSDESAKNTILSIYKHKESVYNKIIFLAKELISRAKKHDNSKLMSPELDYLIAMDKEGKQPYGSNEYFKKMEKWKCFFDAHYNNENNKHHPDHFPNGVDDMTIIDLCEFMIDVVSYFDDLDVKDAINTIDKQQERFGFSDQIAFILKNTLIEYYAKFGNEASLYSQYVNHYLNKHTVEENNSSSKIDIVIDEANII